MDVSKHLGGSFLSQTDLVQPYQLMSIRQVDERLVGPPSNAEQKICLTFSGQSKPLGLNRTNLKRIAELYGTDTDHWINQKLLVYRSTTSYGGKPMLCVRVCGPQAAPPEAICDPQGGAVFYQPQATDQKPAAPPRPNNGTAPWEVDDQDNQNSPPSA